MGSPSTQRRLDSPNPPNKKGTNPKYKHFASYNSSLDPYSALKDKNITLRLASGSIIRGKLTRVDQYALTILTEPNKRTMVINKAFIVFAEG